MTLRLVEGDPVGLPPEDSQDYLKLKMRSARVHGSQALYDSERAARSARWLRDNAERLPKPWADLCREDLKEPKPGWFDFLADHEEAIRGKSYAEARTAQERRTAAAKATIGEVRPAHRVKDKEACNLHTSSQEERAQQAGISRRTQIKLDRLARERPDLLEEVKAGRLSAHGAAIEAGIVKVPTTLEKLRKLWSKATDEERAEFLATLSELPE